MQVARIFVTDEFMSLRNWHDLYVDFYNLKVCGEHPPYWGRDAAMWQKPFGKVQLTDSHLVEVRWSQISDPFKRTIKETESDHDSWLLYAFDTVDNRYLLLTVFGPNAHVSDEFQAFVRELDAKIVKPWIVGRGEHFEPPEDYEP